MRIKSISLFGNGIYCPESDTGVILLGTIGSGKSTLSYELVNNHGFKHIGDDNVQVNLESVSMSWGSNSLGPWFIAKRPSTDLEELHDGMRFEYEKKEICDTRRVFDASINLGVYLNNPFSPFS